jgi:hypothetical protein
MADVKELPAFVLLLVMVGMILGVGILVFDNFGQATYNAVSQFNESFTGVVNNTNVTLTYGNWSTGVSTIRNSSGADITSTTLLASYPVEGKMKVRNDTGCDVGATCYVDYAWKNYNTQTRSTMTSMTNATSPIGSTWLPLIVTVLVLAIILTLVIKSFSQNR